LSIDAGAGVIWPAAPDESGGPGPSAGRIIARGLPALAVALLLGWLFEPWLGIVIALVATTITVLALVWPAAARVVERVLAAVAWAVGRVLTAVILTVLFVVVFLPVGLISRLVRRDPLTVAETRPGTTWLTRWGWAGSRLPARTYASERDLQSGRRAGRVAWAVGLVALIIGVDLILGTLLVDPPAEGTPPPVATGGPTDIPALAGLPYVPKLFTEIFAAESGTYDPLNGWRLEDFDGRWINIADGERATHVSTAEDDPFVVWFFGGSAMYGFGQRDEHTLPSELVRRAEAEGINVEAHNFGTPAYGHWQEVQLFNRLVTERPAPDLVVFYDGYNDLTQQITLGPDPEPSHVLADVQRADLEGTDAADETSWSDVREYWADHSAVTNLWRRIDDRFFDDDEPTVALTEADSVVADDLDADAVVSDYLSVYARGRDLARAVAGAYGIDVEFWWQPTLYTKDPVDDGEAPLFDRAANRTPLWDPIIEDVRAALPAEVSDLSDVLDGQPGPVFWDTVHTNEAGVQVIADAAWPLLREAISSRQPTESEG
jgi:lysophospholipase L1-like esterase